MKAENILDAIGTINDEAVQDARVYKRARHNKTVRWGAMAACAGLIITITAVIFPGILREPSGAPDILDGDATPGEHPEGFDPIIESKAVYPTTEDIRDAEDATTESVDEDSAYVTENEPKKELTVTEAISSEPFGSLYPEIILDGYVLENDTVGLYDGTVMKAVYCNDSIGDVLTITIAAKEYFGDVERNTILQYKQDGTKIYLESGEYMVAYYFSTQNIANIENFERMVTSATSFKK